MEFIWSNDDDDSAEVDQGVDIPGQPAGTANYSDAMVNGIGDLVDFFPVYLDIKQLLTVLPPSASIKYKLKQAEGALNFVYTNQTRTQAFDYHRKILTTGFGPAFTQAAGAATTEQITAAGVELNAAFFDGIKSSDWGDILVEARTKTTAPLVLSVEKDGNEVASISLNINISSVEDMFRHVDLTGAAKEYKDDALITPPIAPRPSNINEPSNWPDKSTNGKYFVFVHGFNVDASKARGWQAEVFKRLHALGSKARFVGVTWNGTPPSLLPGKYLDYHKAVFQAFKTGDALKDELNFTNGADVTLAAHSLGNIVASEAIQSGGFTPARYYMINAASPIEAYSGDAGTAQFANMTEDRWRPFVDEPGTNRTRLYAANWHKLFTGTGDSRESLTWKQSFANVVPRAYNFFSGQEDVVANADNVTSASILDVILGDGLAALLNGTNSWKMQELKKGVSFTTSAASASFERRQGGWGFNSDWYKVRHITNSGPVYGVRYPSEISETEVPSEALKSKPFFGSFQESDLTSTDATKASTCAGKPNVKYDVLARAIPAMSNAVAANNMASFGSERNFNMPVDGVARDPANGAPLLLPNDKHTWRHSDFKNMALPYVYPMYEKMINLGGLDK